MRMDYCQAAGMTMLNTQHALKVPQWRISYYGLTFEEFLIMAYMNLLETRHVLGPY